MRRARGIRGTGTTMPRNLVQAADIVDIAQYERMRPQFRKDVMALKERRRVEVGPNFTFLFENHTTVLYQIQEMMHVERMVEEKAIRHEIDTYNELIPEEGSLSATLLLEYDDRALRDDVLPGLMGIDRHVWLEVGELPRVAGEFDPSQIGEERVSSVQYVRFALSPEHRGEWRNRSASGQVRIVVDHPNYSHEGVLAPTVAEALAEDFGASG